MAQGPKTRRRGAGRSRPGASAPRPGPTLVERGNLELLLGVLSEAVGTPVGLASAKGDAWVEPSLPAPSRRLLEAHSRECRELQHGVAALRSPGTVACPHGLTVLGVPARNGVTHAVLVTAPRLARPPKGKVLEAWAQAWRISRASLAKGLSGLPRTLPRKNHPLLRCLAALLSRAAGDRSARDADASLRGLLAALPDAALILDRDSRVLIANEVTARRFGVPAGRIEGRSVHEFMDPQVARVRREIFYRVLQTGEGTTFEDQHVGRTLENRMVPILDERGEVVRVAAFSRDITARRQADKALHESEERYRSLAEGAQDLIYILSAEGRVDYVNPAGAATFGQEASAALGRSIAAFLTPSEAGRIIARVRTVLARGAAEGCVELRTVRGSRWFDYRMVALRADDGQATAAMGIARDVTERERAQAELFASRQMLRAVLDTIPQRVSWKDREGRYLGCSQGFARNAGLSRPEDIEGKTDFDLPWPTMAEKYRTDDRAVMESDAPRLGFEEAWPLADGEVRTSLTSKVPLHDAEGRVIGVLGTYEDVTERRRIEGELRRTSEELDRFFSLSQDLLCIADTEGWFRRLNPVWEATLGYSREELLSRRFLDLVHPEDVPATLELVARLSDQQPVAEFVSRWRRQDGSYRVLEWRATPQGRLFYAAARDVTARAEAEAEREKMIGDLQKALAQVKTLRGLLPICAGCKKIRDDNGYWQQVEVYVSLHTGAEFSHGLCPNCFDRIYGPEGVPPIDPDEGSSDEPD